MAFTHRNRGPSAGITEEKLSDARLCETMLVEALIAHRSGDRDKAMAACDDALRHGPQCVPALILKGELVLEAGQLREAMTIFRQALGLQPAQSYRYEQIASLLRLHKHLKETTQIYELADKNKIEHDTLYQGMANALLHLGHAERALSYLERLVERNPSNASYLNSLAGCFEKLNNINKAIMNYKIALEIEPSNLKIMYNLAAAYHTKGDDSLAIELLEALLGMNPEHQKATETLRVIAAGRRAAA